MSDILSLGIRCARKLLGSKGKIISLKYEGYLDLKDQDANDYITKFLCEKTIKGKMISKFGTIELNNIVACYFKQHRWNLTFLRDIFNYNAAFDARREMVNLCKNAGFFPNDVWLGEKYYQRMLRDMSEIDVLGSYIYQEKYVNQFLTGITKRVNLDGYYAPFLWKNPWTRVLEGKRVLVVHPFVESIRYQYENNREKYGRTRMCFHNSRSW